MRDFQDDKVLGQPRRCYTPSGRARREKTLPDVLSKEEVRAILGRCHQPALLVHVLRAVFCRATHVELPRCKPDDINVSRSLIRVRQGKGTQRPFHAVVKTTDKVNPTEYRELYKPKVWLLSGRRANSSLKASCRSV